MLITAPSRRALLCCLAGGCAALALPARAAGLNKTLRLVVASAPGSTGDLIARLLAEPLAKPLGQAVAVENRPGPGGVAGALAVAQAAPDATTLLLASTLSMCVAPFATDKPPYDPIEAYTHIALIGSIPLVLAAHPRTGIASLAELEARARKEGRLAFGSAGAGSLGHVYGELMKAMLGLNLVHTAPRPGSALAADLLTGTPGVGIDTIAALAPYFQSGQLVPLVVTSAERSPMLPDVPSVADFGHRKLVLEDFYGLSAPAKLPPAHAARLGAACTQVLALPEVRKRLLELNLMGSTLAPGAFAGYVRSQAGQLAPVIKAAGLRL
jgi:tripartite-type tricarboxylate transporter receptor subunit TctC